MKNIKQALCNTTSEESAYLGTRWTSVSLQQISAGYVSNQELISPSNGFLDVSVGDAVPRVIIDN